MSASLLDNHQYAAVCVGGPDDPVPDCGHEHCGLLCDDSLLSARLERRRAGGREPALTAAHVRAEGLLRHGCKSYGEVSRRTGLSHQTVGRLAKALGVSSAGTTRSTDEAQDDAIAALNRQGLSVRTIAAELGLAKSTVARRVSQLVQVGEAAC